MKLALAAVVLALSAPSLAAPVEVMVLGSYHFANPGRDINNLRVDTVLTPDRQRQLDSVARAIARFKPTRVMVEMQGKGSDLAIAEYGRFDDAMLAREASEIVQLGYRTARMAGVKTVHGIDEQPKDGEPDYFPFDKVQAAAKQFGQTSVLDASNAGIADWLKDFGTRQKSLTVTEALIAFNAPGPATGMDAYYGVLGIGDHDNQAGADLNAMWYLRNAKIFAKLMSVAKPGDRVLVVYGSGHNFWLRHFAGLTPGYRNVDPLPFLKAAK
ncbi:MAG: hypothetical protein DCF31_10070 [Alphaproteobacteria bacterium]|nr:MAG: hypothetical protein DCF31_10070 [Alphaproteobacteria bacterium]